MCSLLLLMWSPDNREMCNGYVLWQIDYMSTVSVWKLIQRHDGYIAHQKLASLQSELIPTRLKWAYIKNIIAVNIPSDYLVHVYNYIRVQM